jgi:hypothetical protein
VFIRPILEATDGRGIEERTMTTLDGVALIIIIFLLN